MMATSPAASTTRLVDDIIIRAARLMFLSPYEAQLTASVALLCISGDIEKSQQQINDILVADALGSLKDEYTIDPSNSETVLKRAVEIWRLNPSCLPNVQKHFSNPDKPPDLTAILKKKPMKSNALRLVGCKPENERKFRTYFDRELEKNANNNQDTFTQLAQELSSSFPPKKISISLNEQSEGKNCTSISPVSMASSSFISFSNSSSDTSSSKQSSTSLISPAPSISDF